MEDGLPGSPTPVPTPVIPPVQLPIPPAQPVQPARVPKLNWLHFKP